MGLAMYEGIEYLVSLLSDLIRLNCVVFALCIYTGLEPLKLHYKKYSACISLTRCFLGESLMQTEEIECGHYLYLRIGNFYYESEPSSLRWPTETTINPSQVVKKLDSVKC